MRNLGPSLAVLLLSFASLAAADVNLIKNAGLEDAPTAAQLPGGGWWLATGRGELQAAVDRRVAHGGTASVRLSAKEEARGVLVSAPFDVAPGDELQFSGWVRCERAAGTSRNHGNFGLAFRDAGGRIFERAYVSTEDCRGEWTLLSGKAIAPAAAVRAELHLGYNDAPGTLWYDDVQARITNPLSLALKTGAQPWTGPQTITVRVISRQSQPFRGTVQATIGRTTSDVPLTLEPGAEQLVNVPISLGSVGVFDYRIRLLDGGTPLHELKGKFRTTAPLVLAPACPCYLPTGTGRREIRVDARIVVNPAQRAGLRFTASLVDPSGAQIESATADASSGETAGAVLHVPTDAAMSFTVTAKLQDAAGQELAQAETDVHVASGESARVTMGADGFLRIAGKPHLPIGLYASGRYDEMGRAGFSATHNYGITTGEAGDALNPNDAHLKDLLDQSWRNGMRMMVELPRKAIEKAQWAQVRRRIETFRYHPGLLCWGSEERVARGEAPLANIAALYRLIHDLDPDHPLVLGDTREPVGKLQKDRRNFFPDEAMDAGIWWWYPIPLHGPDGNGLDGREADSGLLQPPSWLTTTLSRKPLWIAIQSYQQPRKDARFPTPAEYRAMAYLSLINGVKGLWFYTGSGQRDWQGKPAGLLNKLVEGHWDYVQRLVRELRELEPVLTAPSAPGKITLQPTDAPVEFATRELNGVLHLIAANKSGTTQRVRFTGQALLGKKATVLAESGASAADIDGDAMPAEFGPFGVHVYRFAETRLP